MIKQCLTQSLQLCFQNFRSGLRWIGLLSIDKALPKPLRVILRGVGQVFFCCNAVTGFIFLIALYVGEITAGLAATGGVISSTAAAYLLGLSEDDIDAGLYGFNGTLVGPCLFLFLENTPHLWLYVVLASILSTIVLAALMRILQPYNIPASTSPFVLTCWMFMAAVYAFDEFSRSVVLSMQGIPSEIVYICCCNGGMVCHLYARYSYYLVHGNHQRYRRSNVCR